MSIAPAVDIVHLWNENGTPVRLGWRGHRYRIVASQAVRSTAVHDALTHPAERLIGWDVVAQLEDDPHATVAMQLQRAGSGWVLITVDLV